MAGITACVLCMFFIHYADAAVPVALQASVDTGIQAAESGECEQAIASLTEATRNASFGLLPAYEIEYVYTRIVYCALAASQFKTALTYIEPLLEVSNQRKDFIVHKLGLGPMAGEPTASLQAIRLLGPDESPLVSKFSLEHMAEIERQLDQQDVDGAQTLAFLNALAHTRYEPPDINTTSGALMIRRVRLLMQHDTPQAARDAILEIRDPWALLELKVDHRYAPLREDSRVTRALDLERAVTGWVELRRRRLREFPLLLKQHIEYSRALRLAGRFEDALRVIEQPVAQVSRRNGTRYRDRSENSNWLLQEYALALYDSGRHREGRAILASATRINEHGGPNLSQRILLVRKLVEENQAVAALLVVDSLEEYGPSRYLDVWRRGARVCARSAMADPTPSRSELIVMRKYEQDNRSAYRRAALCADQQGLLAAAVIRDLGDPARRGPMLVWLQPARATPGVTPRELLLRTRIAALTHRADVRAAIDAAGRIVASPFYLSVSELP